MENDTDSFNHKLREIFRELVGERAERVNGSRPAFEAMNALRAALAEEIGDETASDTAFHLADWNQEAAFILAVHLFPERFSSEELREGVRAFLIHAPDHVAAAATLAGYPIQDAWKLGVKIER